jgi:hypothetical protein
MSDCFDYGIKTTLPIICVFDTASNAFLASTRGEGGAGEQFDSALRNQFSGAREHTQRSAPPEG